MLTTIRSSPGWSRKSLAAATISSQSWPLTVYTRPSASSGSVTGGAGGSSASASPGALEPHPPVVRNGYQVVDGVQFAAGVFQVVHAADPGAKLEPQCGLVAHPPRDRRQVLPL